MAARKQPRRVLQEQVSFGSWSCFKVLLVCAFLFSITPAFAQSTTSQDSASTQPDATATPTPAPPQQTQTKTTTVAASGDSSSGSIGGITTPAGTKVSAGGAATQTIPIIVPPGTAGIEPRLSFNYNSQGENSLLGVGWSVSGLPAISRCPRTLAQDNFAGGINYDTNDRFCLDGQRLMVISGSYGSNGAEYRTEVDSFLKIFSYGSAGSGPAYFIVKTKGGETMEFGNSDGSRIQAVGKQEVRVWALSKISDIKGNYLTVSYFKEITTNGEYHPLQIDYTKNDNDAGGLSFKRHVTFEYGSRPDQVPSYVGGSKILTTYLLTNVKTYQGGPDIQSSTLVRNYALTYDFAQGTNRSRVTSITEKDASGVSMPQWQLGWQNGASSGNYLYPADADSPNGIFDGTAAWTGDFNGDGKTDIITHNNGNLVTYFSQGNGQYNRVYAADPVAGMTNTKVQIGDVDGDGIADLMAVNGNGKIVTLLFKGDGSYNEVDVTQPNGWTGTNMWSGDFDGDGRTDLVSHNNGKLIFAFSRFTNSTGTYQFTGQINDPVAGWDNTKVWVGDFNGDHKADLVTENNGKLILLLSNGDGTYQEKVANQPYNWSAINVWAGDFNGDGKTDLISHGNGKLITAFSKGDGTWDSFSVNDPPQGMDNTTTFVGDFNGDGKADLVSHNNGIVTIYSNGNGSYSSFSETPQNGWNWTSTWVGDFDGAGLSSLLTNNNSHFNTALPNSPFPDLVTSITSPFGGQTTIAYGPLTDDTLYAKDTGTFKIAYPDVDIQDPFYVVRNVQVNDGLNPPHIYNYDYTYAGAKANLWGRGSLGFRQTIMTDSSADSKTTTYTNQIFPKIGLPSAIEVDRLSDGAAFRDTNYEYQTANAYSSSPTLSFVAVSAEEVVEWEGGQTSRTIRREMIYDPSFTTGNLIQVHHLGDTGISTDDRYEVTDWSVNTGAWIHRPIRQALYPADQNGNMTGTPLRQKWLYYDNQSYGATPTSGLLTKEELDGGDAQGTGNNNPVFGKNPVTTYAYDPTFGVRTAVTDPRGCQTTMVYEPTKTYPQTVTNCMAHGAGYTYDLNFGVKKSEQDPNGQLTTYNYDTFGRLTAVIGPSDSEANPTIIYDYPQWGNPQQQQVATFRRVQHGGAAVLRSSDYFNGLGRVYQNAHDGPRGTTIQSEATFDSRGLILAATAPHFSTEASVTTSFAYDPLGRQRRVNQPDGTFATTDYFVPGRVDLINENGKLKRKFFDAYSRLIEVDEFNNGGTETYTTNYTYDAADSLILVNQSGQYTSMAYDSLGRKIAMCDPNMGTPSTLTTCSTATQGAWVYAYSPAGDLLTQTDAKNQTLTFTYDLLGRPTFKKQGLTTLVQWTYDTSSISPPPAGGDYPVGRLTQIDQPQTATTTRFAYDNVGNTIQSNRQLLGVWYTMSQRYDILRRIVTETFNDGETVTYNYDGDWVKSITSSNSGNYINDVEYNARGQKSDEDGIPALTYGNGLVSHFTYDPNNFRLTAHTTLNPQTLNYFQNLGYLYDNVGNITSIQDNLGGTAWRNFQYDDLNRLTYAEGPFGANQALISCAYQYSPIGNPSKCSYTFSYGDPMHPSAVTYNPATSKNYSYDTDGNMTSRGSPTLTWDIDNRVTSISSQGGTTYMNYADDGVRVEKDAPTGITLYPFAGVEIDPNGVMTKYIRIGGETFASKKGTSQYFYHNDHLGGINVITDISCTEVQRNEYDPWGSVSKAVGNIEPTHRFTGQELDPETGLYYYGGRYYDPEISRFVSPDPFVQSPDDPQSLNRYSYTINNPQRYIDPTGYEGGDSGGSYIPFYLWIKFFMDLSSHDHKRIVIRKLVNHPRIRPQQPNWGGPLSDSVRVYVDNGDLQTILGIDEPEGDTWDLLQLISVLRGIESATSTPAEDKCSTSSASINAYLKGKHSPMVGQGSNFMATGAKYNLEPRLLVSLAGAETGFGRNITAGQFNALNVLYNGLNSPFSSWRSNINAAGRSLTFPGNQYDLTSTSTMFSTYCKGPGCAAGLQNLNTFMVEQQANVNALRYPCNRPAKR
jgi:RHS repeat-associated protein